MWARCREQHGVGAFRWLQDWGAEGDAEGIVFPSAQRWSCGCELGCWAGRAQWRTLKPEALGRKAPASLPQPSVLQPVLAPAIKWVSQNELIRLSGLPGQRAGWWSMDLGGDRRKARNEKGIASTPTPQRNTLKNGYSKIRLNIIYIGLGPLSLTWSSLGQMHSGIQNILYSRQIIVT